jgi:acyl-CoA hydrolase
MTQQYPEPREARDDLARPGDEVHLDEWIAPDVCDDAGFLRPGKILEWMDVGGALVAARWSRRPVVTAALDGAELTRRFAVGDRVTLRARVAHTGQRSLGVRLAIASASAKQPAVTAFMTFVALGDDGRAERVPRLVPQTPEETALHAEGELRRGFRRELEQGAHALRSPEQLIGAPSPTARRAGDPQILYILRELAQRLAMRRRPLRGALRSPQTSYVHKIEPVRAGKLNFHGTLYGGTRMRWIESVAAMSATAFCEAPTRLVAIHALDFLRPVIANVFVHLDAIAVHADDDTVTVLVRATTEDPLSGASVPTLRGLLTYAPVDGAVLVPGLARGDADQGALFCEVVLRQQLRARIAGLATEPVT